MWGTDTQERSLEDSGLIPLLEHMAEIKSEAPDKKGYVALTCLQIWSFIPRMACVVSAQRSSRTTELKTALDLLWLLLQKYAV